MQEAIAPAVESCIKDPFAELEAALEEEKAAATAMINITADIAELLGLPGVDAPKCNDIVMDGTTVTAPTKSKSKKAATRSLAPNHFTNDITKVSS